VASNYSELGEKMFKILKVYKSIVHGVAFLPLLVTFVLTILALVLTLSPGLQSLPASYDFGGYFQVHEPGTARSILSALLTGSISIMVFSFSMMMVVVNQAASNYSPKVVQTLTSNRSNQYIFGVYVGTIIFTLVIMMHIDSKKIAGGIPQIGLLVNMLLLIYAILLFVRFINNISNSVRINSIVQGLYTSTKKSLANERQMKCTICDIESSAWKSFPANHTGYFQLLRVKPLLSILTKHDAVLQVLPRTGDYYTRESPLFRVNKTLSEEVLNEIRGHFITYPGEDIGENAMYGFRQLREVAVKSLSPGINDPGVATLCIDYLSELLQLTMPDSHKNLLSDDSETGRIILNRYDFPALLDLSLIPIKNYGKKDYTVLNSLLFALDTISLADKRNEWRTLLENYGLAILQDADKNTDNFLEREHLNISIEQINAKSYFNLPPLPVKRDNVEKA
jgi:uncharacterized membrane protein